jgi:hypothetical protein
MPSAFVGKVWGICDVWTNVVSRYILSNRLIPKVYGIRIGCRMRLSIHHDSAVARQRNDQVGMASAYHVYLLYKEWPFHHLQ